MQTILTVEQLHDYRPEDAAGIGALLPYLSSSFDGSPVDTTLLQAIIDSPYHAQFVARLDGTIVGIATISITMGAGSGRKGWLDDFVVDATVQGKGVGQALWDAFTTYCREQAFDLQFTSNPTRTAAHGFYKKNGAAIRDTACFLKKLTD